MFELQVLTGSQAGDHFGFERAEAVIGRSTRADVELTDSHISNRHASIVKAESGYVLRDHHSESGTFIVRGEERFSLAESSGRQMDLKTGDEIEIGPQGDGVRLSFAVVKVSDLDGKVVSSRSKTEISAAEETVEHDTLRALYRAQHAMSFARDLPRMIDAVSRQIFDLLPRATHVTVVLREPRKRGEERGSEKYVPVGSRVRGSSTPVGEIKIASSVFHKVISERQAILTADAQKDVAESASIMAASILSTIAVPLWSGDRIFGVLQVDNRDSHGAFKQSDLDMLSLLSQSASQGFAITRLIRRLQASEEQQRNENLYLKKREENRRFEGIIGESEPMQQLFSDLRRVVDTMATVLVHGETGTGKELIASAVHYWSERKDRLFVAQNCAALPENLLESELFGHVRGAFTGAMSDKKGLFELADGGTLFLDEVGEMPLSLQAKLLRVLQEGEFRPVGADRSMTSNVRIVAATNRDLAKEVKAGRFREDLFYRLNVFPVHVPPLRERSSDIELLANHFLRRYSSSFGTPVEGFSQKAMGILLRHQWPGNVRELENEVQRAVIQVDRGGFVKPKHLSIEPSDVSSEPETANPLSIEIDAPLKDIVSRFEIEVLKKALDEHGGNKSATARTLGITREGLHKKLRNYGIG